MCENVRVDASHPVKLVVARAKSDVVAITADLCGSVGGSARLQMQMNMFVLPCGSVVQLGSV